MTRRESSSLIRVVSDLRPSSSYRDLPLSIAASTEGSCLVEYAQLPMRVLFLAEVCLEKFSDVVVPQLLGPAN